MFLIVSGHDITLVLLTCWEMYDICRAKGLVPVWYCGVLRGPGVGGQGGEEETDGNFLAWRTRGSLIYVLANLLGNIKHTLPAIKASHSASPLIQ